MWILFAIGASAFWGLSYVINERIYTYISVYTALAIHSFIFSIVLFIVAVSMGTLKPDIAAISASSKVFWLVSAGLFVFALAEICIAFSIINKNATLAGLIEISYPLFIALFAYILFKENQLNVGVAIGGALTMIGIAVIYAYSG